MSLGKHNTQDLQQLVKVLMIDPENVSISASPDEKEASKKISATKSASSPALQQQQQKQQQKLVQSKITFMMKNASSHNAAPVAAKTQPGPKCSKVTSSGDGSKVSPGSRASKRRASAETRSGSPANAEEGKRSRSETDRKKYYTSIILSNFYMYLSFCSRPQLSVCQRHRLPRPRLRTATPAPGDPTLSHLLPLLRPRRAPQETRAALVIPPAAAGAEEKSIRTKYGKGGEISVQFYERSARPDERKHLGVRHLQTVRPRPALRR